MAHGRNVQSQDSPLALRALRPGETFIALSGDTSEQPLGICSLVKNLKVRSGINERVPRLVRTSIRIFSSFGDSQAFAQAMLNSSKDLCVVCAPLWLILLPVFPDPWVSPQLEILNSQFSISSPPSTKLHLRTPRNNSPLAGNSRRGLAFILSRFVRTRNRLGKRNDFDRGGVRR